MATYFNAGYFIIKPKVIDFGPDKSNIVHTCSGCINLVAFDYWCLSRTRNRLTEEQKVELELNDKKMAAIQQWTDDKFRLEEIRWGQALPDLPTALTFKNQFFASNKDVRIYSVYFDAKDAKDVIAMFGADYRRDYAIRHNLKKRIKERTNNEEEFVGWDFIGLEEDGCFHTFYCHYLAKPLSEKFDLKLNEYGLFDHLPDTEGIKQFLNDPASGLEPVPWYIVKTMRIKDSA